MLMPKKRFRFNKAYLYGSGAFLLGYGGAMALVTQFAPVYTPNANIATVSEAPKAEEATSATPASSEQNSAQDDATAPTNTERAPVRVMKRPTPTTTVPTPPVVPTQVTPPVVEPVPTEPEEPMAPVIPIVPTPTPDPIIELPSQLPAPNVNLDLF